MNGGLNRDMVIGVLAWKSIHFVEMVCTTRYVNLFIVFSNGRSFLTITCKDTLL